MRRYLPRLAMFASLALAVTACGSTAEARTGGWSHASTPPAGGSAQPVVAAPQASPGQAEKITIEAFDLGFTADDALGAGGRHVPGRVQEHRIDPP